MAETDYLEELDSPEVESRQGSAIAGPLHRAEKRNRVLRLRRQGFSYSQIAETITEGADGGEPVEITESGASYLVRQYVEDMLIEDRENADVLRHIDNERLESMYRRLELDAASTDPKVKARAIAGQLKVVERHAKLNGLDAPSQVNVTGEVNHHLVADTERVKQVDDSFARRHGKAIALPSGNAREVK